MGDWLQQLLNSNGFQPHAYCFLWRRELLWFFIISDAIIAFSYYSIPAALTSFARQREDLAYKWVFWLFGAFIFSCGTTHIMDVVVLWLPLYWVQGYIKFITALISAATAILLWPLIPKALALKSPAELSWINEQLQREVTERQAAQEALQAIRDQLEIRIVERTAELQATNQKLAFAEAKYRNIFEHANEGIFQTTPSGKILTANPALVKMFGYESEQAFSEGLPGRPTHVVAERRTEFIQQIESQGVVKDFESQVYDRQGHTFWISVNARAVKGSEGTIIYYEGSVQNITDRKGSEDQQIALEASQLKMVELQKINALKDDFLSTVSHELRTPMTNIRMAIQLLKRATSIEGQAKYLRTLEVQCDREIDLINDLLSLQRLEANATDLIVEILPLREFLPRVIEGFIDRAKEHEQTIALEIAPEINLFYTDISVLERILDELLNNACKYTPRAGLIQVAISEPDVRYLEFKVSNTSTEISEEELTQIFNKFYRIPRKDPWSQGGTGLGLALVKKLVEQLEGTIHVTYSERLITFTVRLPRLQENTG